MKNQINKIKNSYPYRHKHLLITLSLATALIVPTGVDIVKEFIPESEASYEKKVNEELVSSLEEDVERRTEIIHAGMRQEARIRAVSEIYQDLEHLISLTGEQVELKEALGEIE